MPRSRTEPRQVRLEVEPVVQMSPWNDSFAKRIFDFATIVLLSPFILIAAFIIVCALRFHSPEPVLYRQIRIGRHGSRFEILKFRTMRDDPRSDPHHIAACSDDRVTPVGRFLRQSKLDELPQVINILRGEMSLVGPRPKVPEQSTALFACRPGLTGAATLIFADESALAATVPPEHLPAFYEQVVLPAKQRLDIEYMREATFLSDVQILLKSVGRVWTPRRNLTVDGQLPANTAFIDFASAPSSTAE